MAHGGTLHQLVHEQPGLMDHHEPRDSPRHLRYAAAHGVRLAEGGLLRRIAGVPMALVNSIHAQGLDRLAPGLAVEATAPDGLIEAVRVEGASFALGVQWHPEWRFREDRLSTGIFAAFGARGGRLQRGRRGQLGRGVRMSRPMISWPSRMSARIASRRATSSRARTARTAAWCRSMTWPVPRRPTTMRRNGPT